MARYERFTFLCNTSERHAITELAQRLQGSQSDAVRFVVTEAARQLVQANAALVDTLPTEDPRQEQEGTHAPD